MPSIMYICTLLEPCYGVIPDHELTRPPMLPEIPQEELSASLDAVAMEVLTSAGIDRPPVDMLAVARAFGIEVAWDDRQRGRGRYVRLGRQGGRRPAPTILLRPEPRPERRQWTLAHEIGEHVVHRVFAILMVDPREAAPSAREQMANYLAGRLLLPHPWFAADAAACCWDLTELKARYRTASHELIARRMLDLPPPVIISIFDHRELSFRRSNVPGHVPPPSSVEVDCWRTVHDHNRVEQTSDGTRTIQAWPVHEPGWKREILRTEVELEPVW